MTMKEVDETTWLSRYVMGPIKFLIFLFSLALIAKHDECDKARAERRMPRRGRIWINSRRGNDSDESSKEFANITSNNTGKSHGTLHSFQTRVAVLEVRDALNLEEAFTTSTLLRAALYGILVSTAVGIQRYFW